jgi:hypothetical protein
MYAARAAATSSSVCDSCRVDHNLLPAMVRPQCVCLVLIGHDPSGSVCLSLGASTRSRVCRPSISIPSCSCDRLVIEVSVPQAKRGRVGSGSSPSASVRSICTRCAVGGQLSRVVGYSIWCGSARGYLVIVGECGAGRLSAMLSAARVDRGDERLGGAAVG